MSFQVFARRAVASALLSAVAATLGCSAISGGPQNDPGVVGARPTGYVYTTLYNKGAVLEINTVQSRVDQDPILVGNGPRGLTMDPRGRQLYLYVVCELGNTVAVVDRRNRLVNRTIAVGSRPYAMAIAPSGSRGFVTNTDEDTVSVIDIPTNTVVQTVLLSTPITNPGGLPPQGGTNQGQRLRPKGIATNATGSQVYVACEGGFLCILQGNPGSGAPTTGAGGAVGQIASYSVQRTVQLVGAVAPLNLAVASVNANTDVVYVTDPRANRIFFLNSSQANQADVRDVQGSPYDVAVGRNAAGTPDSVYVSLETRDALQVFSAADLSPRGDAVRVEGRQPQAVEVSSLGNEVYVSLSGSNNVAVFQRVGNQLNLPQVFNLQQLNPSFIAPTGDLALGGFLFN
ncbi:MAG: YncE family protein [Candidatus Sericytochromatia bacterium]|nr:YncE family protein [Candidatus Sericytochromatia bacterium]